MTVSGSPGMRRSSPIPQLRRLSMSTPPLVSDGSSSSGDTSPSEVARSSSLFEAWMARAKVSEICVAPEEVIHHFDSFYRLEEVPSGLIQDPLPKPAYHKEGDFQDAVHAWASTLHLTEGDEYNILGVLRALALAYIRVKKTSNNHSKEHGQCRGIDDIIEIAFSARSDCHCDFKTKENYRLVELNGNPDAQSDTLVTFPSKKTSDKIRDLRLSFTNKSIVDHLYWSTCGVQGDFSIIGFAGEFKKDDSNNKNQLIMVLTTAQLQRKALLLKKSIIMGATGCHGFVQIYSSYWSSNDSILHIYKHKEQFNLADPIQVVRLYTFCSKLKKHIQDSFALELQQWTPPSEMILKNLMWRSQNQARKRRRTEAGGSTNGGNGGRGDNDGPTDADGPADVDGTDADGFDDDWYIQIMKWRNEASGGEKEVRAISCEGAILNMAQLQTDRRHVASVTDALLLA